MVRSEFAPSSGTATVLAGLALGLMFLVSVRPLASQEREPTGKPWIDMDYGQFLTASLQVGEDNIAYKGIAVRLDGSGGGVTAGEAFAVFDTDTLRWAAGWRGPQFCDWRSIVWDGSHQTHPSIVGERVFVNPVGPGWARPGTQSFEDPRIEGRDGRHYGPLPRGWGRWKGLHLHGEDVVLSYSVGPVDVLELAGAEGRAMTRTLQLGPRKEDLLVRVVRTGDAKLEYHALESGRSPLAEMAVLVPRRAESSQASVGSGRSTDGESLLDFDGRKSLEVAGGEDFDFAGSDFTIVARIRTTAGGTILARAPRKGNWKPGGTTFFVRGGRLAYDVGWVGDVVSRRRVNDGKWHDVAATYDRRSGVVELFVDGESQGRKKLQPETDGEDMAVRIGFTSPNFPRPESAFRGEIAHLGFHQRRLSEEEIRGEPTDEGRVARWVAGRIEASRLTDVSGNGHSARAVAVQERRGGKEQIEFSEDSAVLTIGVVGGLEGTRWEVAAGALALRIPAGARPTRLKLVYSRVPAVDSLTPAVARLEEISPPRDLEPLTRGGPARWGQALTTRPGTLGRTDGPLVVDVLTAPMDNPWRSWMRLGGFDFFADGERAAVCTWMGDVWTVEGIGGEVDELVWRRIATGLFQPLGLKVVDEVIYVLGRDQITRLHDLNGDGETDFYESFNHDAQVTEHFHEFAMDLQTDADGNFYYCKGGRHALDAVVPQHGTLIKVSPDGERSEILANGFRAPNGLHVNPDGSFIISDQEGHWTPENRINLVQPGGFYGYMWSYHRGEKPTEYDRPICWVDHDIDISPAAQLPVPEGSWGPLGGRLLSLSYGMGKVLLVPHETVRGQVQGGVVQLPVAIFPTGVMRGRFHPGDGQLYTCGLFGWSSRRTYPGGLYRVRYTGKELHVPLELHATEKGVSLTFSAPLEARRAARTGSYRVTRWNYKWLQRYGTDDFRVSDGRPGRERVDVRSAELSDDGKAVFLVVDDMRPCHQMKVEYRLQAASGARISDAAYLTIHELGEARD